MADTTKIECRHEVFSNHHGTTKAVICSCGFAITYTVLSNYADHGAMMFFNKRHAEELERRKRIAELEAQLDTANEKLQRIADWCAAYPLEVFPKPDMQEVRARLGDELLTRLSADNFRHVVDGIANIAAINPPAPERGANG